jgi:hypothetical protein
MKDPKGNKISIGDRINVLWNFDNNIHGGEITNISDGFVNVNIFSRNISLKNHTKIKKIPDQPKINR